MFSRFEAELGHERLDGVQDRVVAAARAPAHLLVGLEVLRRQLHDPVAVPALAHRLLSFPRLKLPVAFAIRSCSSWPRALGRGLEEALRELPGQHRHAPALPEDRDRAVAARPERERLLLQQHAAPVGRLLLRPHDSTSAVIASASSDALNGVPADAVVADRVDEELGADELEQLAEVHLRDQDLVVAAQHLARVARERVEVVEVRLRDLVPLAAHAPDGGADRAVGRAPAEHERVGAVRVVDLRARGCRSRSRPPSPRAGASSGRGSRGRRRSSRSRRPSRARRSGARARACPGSPTAARASRGRGAYGWNSPSPTVANSVEMSGRSVDLRDQPRLGAVREVGVAEQVDGRAVLERDPRRLDRGVEALRRRRGREHRHRALRVAPEHAPSAGRPAPASSASRSRGRRAGCRGSAAAARA